jgi:hypothetical protein
MAQDITTRMNEGKAARRRIQRRHCKVSIWLRQAAVGRRLLACSWPPSPTSPTLTQPRAGRPPANRGTGPKVAATGQRNPTPTGSHSLDQLNA